MELLASLRNLSRSTPAISFVAKQNLNVLIKVAKTPGNEQIQQVAVQSLRNMTEIPELMKHIQV